MIVMIWRRRIMMMMTMVMMMMMMLRTTALVMTIPTRPGSEDSDNPDGRARLHSVESDPLGEGQESFQHPTGPKLKLRILKK